MPPELPGGKERRKGANPLRRYRQLLTCNGKSTSETPYPQTLNPVLDNNPRHNFYFKPFCNTGYHSPCCICVDTRHKERCALAEITPIDLIRHCLDFHSRPPLSPDAGTDERTRQISILARQGPQLSCPWTCACSSPP